MEFYFEVDLEYGDNPDFYIHIVKQRLEGKKGFRVSSDDALDMIEKEVSIDNIVTRLIVEGAEVEKETIESKTSDDTSNKIVQASAGKL